MGRPLDPPNPHGHPHRGLDRREHPRWRSATGATRRVGVVHAGLNGAAVCVYGGSLAARLCGRHGIGVTLGLVGTTVATAAGYLGGPLATVHRFGTVDPAVSVPPPRVGR